MDLLLERARRLWTGLAGVPVVFEDAAVTVVVSPRALLCPPGWVGLVALGGAAIVTAGDGDRAEMVRRAFDGLPIEAVTDPATVRGVLPVREVLGPATLAYCDEAGFRPVGSPTDHADPGALLARAPREDADECGLDEVTSPVFAVRDGADVVAAAGYRRWPGGTAHLAVLTAPEARGRGLARVVASAAVAHALRSGLFPQWRARPEASRRVARALGFREVGAQLSFRCD